MSMSFSNSRFQTISRWRKNTEPISLSKATQGEINRLIYTMDLNVRKEFDEEMQSFSKLHSRYLADRGLDWDKVQTPDSDRIISYDQLPIEVNPSSLSKLAVLRLNGGSGTTMGTYSMPGAKSALEVKDGMTFLDFTIKQVEHLNKSYGVEILRIIQKYANQPIKITTFSQSRFPRIFADTLQPCPHHARDAEKNWYPPGHGDVYDSLVRSGTLDRLLADGKEYLFISNGDNLAATVDQGILQYMANTSTDFLMEVANKTKADVKGGTLIQYDGSLLEICKNQIPSEYVDDFNSLHKFNMFNTNNLWINLRALKKVMTDGGMDLDVIVNPKVTDDGKAVVQLETAAGSAIKHFKNARAIRVPRSRVVSVKSCSDLLLIKSDVYSLKNGQLVMSDNTRFLENIPVVKLGDHFTKIQDFLARFKTIPTIIGLDNLTVTGDVYFGERVTLRGNVIIIAKEGQRIDVPDGCVLENCLVSI